MNNIQEEIEEVDFVRQREIMNKLRARERMFVEEYLIDYNQTQAAIRAGYSPVSAVSQGHRLMKKPSIKSAISISLANKSKRLGVSSQRNLEEYAKVGYANAFDIIDFDNGGIKKGVSKDDLAAVSSFKIKRSESSGKQGCSSSCETSISLHNKISALDRLSKITHLIDGDNDKRQEYVKIVDDIEEDSYDS